jgi:adenylate cyclase class 2
MAVEIEAKMKVENHSAVRERLRAAGATRVTRTLETNTFFDAPDGSLRTNDRGLRLRRNHDLEHGRDSVVITYKGPRQPGQFKSREEIETTVGDGDIAAELLAALGFAQTLSFEKRRESWQLGGCHVELDELPYLGSFVEIEGPDESTVMNVRRDLGLSDHRALKESYIAMLSERVKTLGISDRVLHFPA